jgi:mannose-6-phosphate isomerase-like protein (cupin superfamily)
MTTPINITNAEHYVWGAVCNGWHLVKTPQLSVIQERVPPHAAETRHSHQVAQQFFYILSGTATFEYDGDTMILNPGDGVHVPPGTVHQFRNESDAEVVFLVISMPPSHGDRIE